ncbi:MAG: hypothetical protein IJR54_04530 [Oscillibacter sp.]|nr:hypothetical protein [Oscillibacter sp.]
MTGEIRIQKRNLKAEFAALAVTFALTLVLFRFMEARGAVAALTAYVLCRGVYGALNPSGTLRLIAWELTDADLVLDGKTIPRASIRAVYCWPNRDAFGHTRPGRVVNIETNRKNTLLRSPDAEALETLVSALNHGKAEEHGTDSGIGPSCGGVDRGG